jgi:hypothetical protein
MIFAGTLIEDLMATVERAEKRAQSDAALVVEASAVERFGVEISLVEPMLAESLLIEPWFASRENADYESKFIGVA